MAHKSSGSMRFEYDVGEIVLCFEPDPTKARVLYEAKVIEQRAVKEPGGKKSPAYVVHFQGWNSSWDRQVEDKFLLRDTLENRELMRKLSDAAKKFCRKNSQRRRKINTILHHAFGGAPPEFGHVSDSDDSEDDSDTGKRSGKGKCGADKKKQKTSLFDFEIPESLRGFLEDDYFYINKRNKLTRVPAKPCVIDILESFMKTFCVNYLCDPSGGREKTRTSSSKHTLKCPPDKCVSLCKEFVDSLRVIFDHTLPVVLLYAAEQQQYEHAMTDLKPLELCAKDKLTDKGDKQSKSDVKADSKPSRLQQQSCPNSPNPSSSHSSSSLQRDPSPPRRVTRQAAQEQPEDSLPSHHSRQKSKSPKHTRQTPKSPRKTDKEVPEQEPVIPIASRTRRRSHFDTAEVCGEVQVKEEPETEVLLNLPGTSQAQQCEYTNGQLEPACSAAGTDSLTMGSSRGREDAMDHILGWQLMPLEVRARSPVTPSQVYGTVHLLRMFVKLPELLKKMNLKDVLLQIAVKFIHHCLQYLVDHQSELFHDQTYVKA